MSVDYTTVGLIANTRRRASLPEGSGLTDNDFLQVLSEQLRSYIPAFLKGIREEFIVAEASVSVTASTVPLPARACGAALRTIAWELSDGSRRDLPRVEPERRNEYGTSGSEPLGYMFQGNNVLLLPPVTSGTLVVSYQQRPGQLVLPTDCAEVDSYSDAATFGLVNPTPSWLVAGVTVDVVSGTPNFPLGITDGVVATVVDAGITSDVTITGYNDALPTGLVGGYICRATETPIPQVPPEVHDLLAQAAAYNVCASTGSTRTSAVKEALKDLREEVSMLLSPRADGSARVVVSRSRLGRWR